MLEANRILPQEKLFALFAIYDLNPTRQTFCVTEISSTFGTLLPESLSCLGTLAAQGQCGKPRSSVKHETGSGLAARLGHLLRLGGEASEAGGQMWKEELCPEKQEAAAHHPYFGR